MALEDSDFELLQSAVEKTGRFVLEAQGSSPEVWLKEKGEPVSEIDLAANALLKEQLMGGRPDYGWLSEESVDDQRRLSKERVWIVDPIDGTRAYLRGGENYSVSVALTKDGRPVAGVVFAPARNELFTAKAGQGAWLNGQKIRVSKTADLAGSSVIANEGFMRSNKLWKQPWPALRFSQINSVALRLCLVAGGNYDFVITGRKKRDWDLAAAELILREAGGRCCGPDRSDLVFNRASTDHGPLIGSNSILEEQIFDVYRHSAFAADAGSDSS